MKFYKDETEAFEAKDGMMYEIVRVSLQSPALALVRHNAHHSRQIFQGGFCTPHFSSRRVSLDIIIILSHNLHEGSYNVTTLAGHRL